VRPAANALSSTIYRAATRALPCRGRCRRWRSPCCGLSMPSADHLPCYARIGAELPVEAAVLTEPLGHPGPVIFGERSMSQPIVHYAVMSAPAVTGPGLSQDRSCAVIVDGDFREACAGEFATFAGAVGKLACRNKPIGFSSLRLRGSEFASLPRYRGACARFISPFYPSTEMPPLERIPTGPRGRLPPGSRLHCPKS